MKKLTGFLLLFFLAQSIQAQVADTLPCPDILLEGPTDYKVADGKIAVISMKPLLKAYENYSLTYNWSVSSGSISRGQGTGTIDVETVGLKDQAITATLEIGGLKRSCTNVKSITIDVIGEKPPQPKTKTKAAKTTVKKA